MITSDYLQKAVNFDLPILVVGPGLQWIHREDIDIPMDIALIWFAEHSRRRIDVFDIPPETHWSENFHGLDHVKAYMDSLAKRTNLVEVRYIIGDIAETKLPTREYGTIWDHGTLESLIFSCRTLTQTGPGMYDKKRRIPKIVANYRQALRNQGKAIFAGEYFPFAVQAASLDGFSVEEIVLGTDRYTTSLTPTELGVQSDFVWKDGYLLPHHNNWICLLELTKVTKKRK